MQKPFVLLTLTVLLISGCASTSTQMVNDDGQTVNCGASGFGLIGAPAALAIAQSCIDKQKAAGFREAGTASTAHSGAGVPPLVSSTPSIISSKDGSFKLALPAGWISAPPPASAVSAQIFAKQSTIDAAMMVSVVNSADVPDLQVYAEGQRTRILNAMTQSAASDLQKIKVNGFDAIRGDIGGVLKNGLKFHYLITSVKTDKKILHVIVWCVESKFSANRSEFEQLSSGLQI